MAKLLDRAMLAEMANDQRYLDPTAYPNGYMVAVLAAAQAAVTAYLRFDPTLSVHTDETGMVDYMFSGPWQGRYLLTVRHRPLIPGDASVVFSALSLTYALASVPASTVPLEWVEVENSSGRVFALASGMIDALAGSIGFAYGATPGLRATGYRASYLAGWSTGLDDATVPLGVTPDPIPPDITLACALLAQERLAMDAAQKARPGNPMAGTLQSVRVGERAEVYRAPASGSATTLGYGSPLAVSAQAILAPYRKTPVAALIG